MRKTPAAPATPAETPKQRSMSRKILLLTALSAAILLPGCKDKSEAEKAEDERAILREAKRKKAIEIYKTIAREYPDDPKAAEAKQKAAALEALAPKQ